VHVAFNKTGDNGLTLQIYYRGTGSVLLLGGGVIADIQNFAALDDHAGSFGKAFVYGVDIPVNINGVRLGRGGQGGWGRNPAQGEQRGQQHPKMFHKLTPFCEAVSLNQTLPLVFETASRVCFFYITFRETLEALVNKSHELITAAFRDEFLCVYPVPVVNFFRFLYNRTCQKPGHFEKRSGGL
jgi:hypothetical protein